MRIRAALRGRWALAAAISLGVFALMAPSAGAQESPPAPLPPGTPGSSVAGFGTTTLGERFPPDFQGDQISVALGAITLPDGTDKGVFMVRHVDPEGALLAQFSGEIDCLASDGTSAVATGVIMRAETPGLPPGEGADEGTAAGVVVADGGPEGDRMSWAFGPVGQTCDELPPATVVDVQHGDFFVGEWSPEPNVLTEAR